MVAPIVGWRVWSSLRAELALDPGEDGLESVRFTQADT